VYLQNFLGLADARYTQPMIRPARHPAPSQHSARAGLADGRRAPATALSFFYRALARLSRAR